MIYDSERRIPTTAAVIEQAQDPLPASFGELWLSSLHRKLTVHASLKSARAARGDGRVISFVGNGSGVFTTQANVDDRLLSVGGAYRYIDAASGTQETYNSAGLLTRIDHTSGRSLVFTYSDASTPPAVAPSVGLLLNVADNFGRGVNMKYGSNGLISQITDPTGRTIVPSYASGNLVQLAWQDSGIRQFLYEVSALPWALTGVVDERGLRKGKYAYDSAGRAISTEGAGGVNRYSVSYSSPPAVVVTDTLDSAANLIYRTRRWQTPAAVTLSSPNGTSASWGTALFGNQPQVTTRSQPAGAGCAASTSAQTYDANGNVASKDDFNGTRTCYANDLSRNLETTRVEGLANTQACSGVTPANATLPTGARKTSTQWHPDWRLEVKRAEPKKLTTNVYNGQPDPLNGNAVASCAPGSALLPDGKPIAVLCKTVEQATTDANGAQGFGATLHAGVPNRVQRYTYNQYGQVLTATDPRSNTSTYDYYGDTAFTGTDPNATGHTIGDLQSVTNAAGHVTQYNLYDKSGRLLRSTDANGAVTDNQYSPRGWLTQVSVAPAGGGTPLVSSYGYDPAGKLTQVTYPGQSPIGYSYDAAHRLVGITDSAGNSVTYTLDNSGNRLGEQFKDATGALARTITRAFDALNRVQSVSGGVQ